jgi:uncharacterized protein YggU (UPF0235/DUF167 family)
MQNSLEEYAIWVKPGSKKAPLVESGEDGRLTVYVRERAVEGKANEAALKLLAAHFGVPKSRLVITRGHASRTKVVRFL